MCGGCSDLHKSGSARYSGYRSDQVHFHQAALRDDDISQEGRRDEREWENCYLDIGNVLRNLW